MRILIWNKRTSRGVSLRKLSGLTGISKTTLQRIEKEDASHPPNIMQLKKIAVALNCKITDLLDDSDL